MHAARIWSGYPIVFMVFNCVVTVERRIVTGMNATLTKVSIKKIVPLLRHNAMHALKHFGLLFDLL